VFVGANIRIAVTVNDTFAPTRPKPVSEIRGEDHHHSSLCLRIRQPNRFIHHRAIASLLRRQLHDGPVKMSGDRQRAVRGLLDPFPPAIECVLGHYRSSWMPDLALGRLRTILDLGEQLRLDPDATVGDALAVRLSFTDQRRKTSAERLRALSVEAVINLAGIIQIGALAPAE
jgi:hypothetical protein